MAAYMHEVGADVRAASTWDPDYGMYRASDGRYWSYRTPEEGSEILDAFGGVVTVARWAVEPRPDRLMCRRCGHTWIPRRRELPKVCPSCKRTDWAANL